MIDVDFWFCYTKIVNMSDLNKITSKIKQNIYLYLLEKAVNNKTSRKFLIDQFDKKIYQLVVEEGPKDIPRAVQLKKYKWIKALLKQVFDNYNKGYISSQVGKKIIKTLGPNFFSESLFKKVKESFQNKYKTDPPHFIVVSPTQKCNLKCEGCYAASSSQATTSLPFDIFDRILRENHDIFGSRFVTISGGEPLLYQSQGKNLLDLFEKYSDTYFIFYTNGTLITREITERLAKLGNASPQISVEGFEKETDARRGKGIFQKILKTTADLRESGVPFVISVTATKKNVDILLSDEFYNFWFDKQGGSYMWMFQLMPIGRGKDVFDLMPNPEQRVKLYRKWESLLERNYPVADFWNSGVLSNGCIAYGRPGGYFYIDWSGKIMPCVFMPYYVDTVYDLYKQGKTIADALFSDFFEKGREWQKKHKQWLMPCSIRDNYQYFREIILPENARGEDESATAAKNSKEYFKGLFEYDKKLKELTQPIWDKEYKK